MTSLRLILASLVWTAGIRAPRGGAESNTTSPVRVWYISDMHWGGVVTGGFGARQRIRQMVSFSNARGVDAWIFGGDWQWDYTGDEMKDSSLWVMRDSLVAPLYVTLGNHDFDYPDTGTVRIYNDYTQYWPDQFTQATSNTDRGSRWYGRRIRSLAGARTNVHVISVNNTRNTPGQPDYYGVVNPTAAGVSVYPYDFDGISDSTSVQRRDIAGYARENVEWCDWVILSQHRTAHGGVDISIRPNQEGIFTDADSSQVLHLESILSPKRFILAEADQHENKVLDLYRTHYTLSACTMPRTFGGDAVTNWDGRAFMFAYYDSAYASQAWSAVVDSIGADGQNYDTDGNPGTITTRYSIIQEIEFSGRTAVVRPWLFHDFYEPAALDSIVFRLN